MTPWLIRVYQRALGAAAAAPENPRARAGVNLLHLTMALTRKSVADTIPVRASSLAYWTLTSVVPVLLLAFSLVVLLGLGDAAREGLRDLLYNSILAGSVEEVASVLDAVLAGTNLRTMGVVGLAGLLATGAGLYFQVEKAYNDIFQVRIRRGVLLRFTVFYAIITLGPLALTWGLVTATTLERGLSATLLAEALPRLVTTLGFVGALRLLPDTRVRWRAALAGGLVTSLLFEGAKLGLWAYVDLFGARHTMTLLYGSLAFLPFFLLWLYVVWVVVLFGVEVAYGVQHYARLVDAERRAAFDPTARKRHADGPFAVAVMTALTGRYQQGDGPAELDELSRACCAEPHHVQEALDVLEDAGLVVQADGRWLPAKPASILHPEEVLRVWRGRMAPLPLIPDGGNGGVTAD